MKRLGRRYKEENVDDISSLLPDSCSCCQGPRWPLVSGRFTFWPRAFPSVPLCQSTLQTWKYLSHLSSCVIQVRQWRVAPLSSRFLQRWKVGVVGTFNLPAPSSYWPVNGPRVESTTVHIRLQSKKKSCSWKNLGIFFSLEEEGHKERNNAKHLILRIIKLQTNNNQ